MMSGRFSLVGDCGSSPLNRLKELTANVGSKPSSPVDGVAHIPDRYFIGSSNSDIRFLWVLGDALPSGLVPSLRGCSGSGTGPLGGVSGI